MVELIKAAKFGKAQKVQEILENKGKYLVYGYDEVQNNFTSIVKN